MRLNQVTDVASFIEQNYKRYVVTISFEQTDIVVIDEVEQVLAHLSAETLRDNRHDALMLFSHYLQRSKKIYALDADLNRVTAVCIPELLGRSSRKKFFVVVNEWAAPPRER